MKKEKSSVNREKTLQMRDAIAIGMRDAIAIGMRDAIAIGKPRLFYWQSNARSSFILLFLEMSYSMKND